MQFKLHQFGPRRSELLAFAFLVYPGSSVFQASTLTFRQRHTSLATQMQNSAISQ